MTKTIPQTKIEKYNHLVERIQQADCLELNGLNKVSKIKFQSSGAYSGFKNLCFPEEHEVSLWSYWEGGRSHLDADILVVGQDWGAFSIKGEKIVPILESGSLDKSNFRYMDGNRNPTNIALCELFRKLGSYDLVTDNNSYTELFFTNLIPWYRESDASTGGFDKGWIPFCGDYFTELVEIIKPHVILCLGQSVFGGIMQIASAADQIHYRSYNDIIASPFPVRFGNNKAIAFPLAHPGTYGTLNRNGRRKGIDREHQLNFQKQDWQKVAEYIRQGNECYAEHEQSRRNI